MGKSMITRIIVGIIISILLIVMVVLLVNILTGDKPDETSPYIEQQRNETKGKLVKVNNITDLYIAKTCIQKYLENYSAISAVGSISGEENINTNNTAIQIADPSERNKEHFTNSTISMLGNDYINKKGITKDNINREDFILNNLSIEIYNLYYLTNYENTAAYFANGIARDVDNNKNIEFNYIVVVDNVQHTFELYLDDYIEENNFLNLVEGSEVEFNLPESVENREFNTYSIISVKYEAVAQDMFHIIRRILLYDTEKAYSLLNDEMKDRFPTFESFESFLKEYNSKIFGLTYGGYKLKTHGDGESAFAIYNSDNTICITIYFDGFSSFKYSITGI